MAIFYILYLSEETPKMRIIVDYAKKIITIFQQKKTITIFQAKPPLQCVCVWKKNLIFLVGINWPTTNNLWFSCTTKKVAQNCLLQTSCYAPAAVDCLRANTQPQIWVYGHWAPDIYNIPHVKFVSWNDAFGRRTKKRRNMCRHNIGLVGGGQCAIQWNTRLTGWVYLLITFYRHRLQPQNDINDWNCLIVYSCTQLCCIFVHFVFFSLACVRCMCVCIVALLTFTYNSIYGNLWNIILWNGCKNACKHFIIEYNSGYVYPGTHHHHHWQFSHTIHWTNVGRHIHRLSNDGFKHLPLFSFALPYLFFEFIWKCYNTKWEIIKFISLNGQAALKRKRSIWRKM